MCEIMNEELLNEVNGGAEEGTVYKYEVEWSDWVHCGVDRRSVWLILDTVSTNDGGYLVKVRKSDPGTTSVVLEDYNITKPISHIYRLCEEYGGNIKGLR